MPVVLQVSFTGDTEWGNLTAQKLRGQMRRMRREIGRKSLAALQAMIPERTGQTRDAAYFRSRDTEMGFEVDLGIASRRYDIFQMLVHGTPHHSIPGNPLLVFFWERGPRGPGVYFFRWVDHPGFKPKIDPGRLEDQVEDTGLREMNAGMRRFTSEVGCYADQSVSRRFFQEPIERMRREVTNYVENVR